MNRTSALALLLASFGAFHTARAAEVEALRLDVSRADMATLAEALTVDLREHAQSIQIEQTAPDSSTWIPVALDHVAVGFRVTDLAIIPAAGRLHVDLQLDAVTIDAAHLSFGQDLNYYCSGIHFDSRGQSMPVSFDLTPQLDAKGQLVFQSLGSSVGLSSSNFEMQQPDSCNVVWGLDGLIAYVLPGAVNLVRDQIAAATQRQLAQRISKTANSLNHLLDATWTFPVAARPFPSFYTTLAVQPARFAIDSSGLHLVMGGDVRFDPDHQRKSLEDFSRIGLSLAFFNEIFAQARDNGLFNLTIDPLALGFEPIKASALYPILPDARTRFPATAPVEVVVTGHPTLSLRQDLTNALALDVSDLGLEIAVNHQPYVFLNLAGSLPLSQRFDGQRLALAIKDFNGLKANLAGFAGEVRPADQSFDRKAFPLFSAEVFKALSPRGDEILGFNLPRLGLGQSHLAYGPLALEDGYLTLDLQLVNASN